MQMQHNAEKKNNENAPQERELATLKQVVHQMKTTLAGTNNYAIRQNLLRSIAKTEKKITYLEQVLELETRLSATGLGA